jgi:hypothetical protein
MQSKRAVLILALLLLLPSGAATAIPRVYHSPADDGVQLPYPLALPGGGSHTLHLYMDETDGSALPSPVEACLDGIGDERCGWDIAVESDGGVTLTSFTPSGDVIAGLTATRLRANGGKFDTGELGPVKLGDLIVVSAGSGDVSLAQGIVVDAALLRQSLAPAPIVHVPEPAIALLLAMGAGLLPALARLRHNRSGTGLPPPPEPSRSGGPQ